MDISAELDDNFNGVVPLSSGSTLDMSDAWALAGQIPSAGGVSENSATTRVGVLEANGNILVDAGSLTVESNLDTNGQAVQFGTNTSMRISGTTSTISSGTSVFGSGNNILVNDPGSTLTLETGAVVGIPLQNDGTLIIGTFPGSASVDSYWQSDDGTLEIEIDTVTDYERLSVTDGSAVLGGVLDIQTASGFLPAVGTMPGMIGDTSQIITAPAVALEFATSDGLHAGSGIFYEVQ